VDHGKTTLVRALTGVDTDRLREEKERGMSIELGFAPFPLPSGRLAAVVDVPGHQRFLKNMLAGASGMDVVVMVIAADEGVMPQTLEHLDIIELFGAKAALVALTKIDLLEPEGLETALELVREQLRDTSLAQAPLVPVSAKTGAGLQELLAALDGIATEVPARDLSSPMRLWADRAFVMRGFGPVVTGTLDRGAVSLGETVEVFGPGGANCAIVRASVRQIQVHNQRRERAWAGERVALNLGGVRRDQVGRGCVVFAPGSLQPSSRLYVRLRIVKRCAKPLPNHARVRVHLGTREVLARVRLLAGAPLAAGEEGWAELRLEEALAAAAGDRFVIRTYSPMITIGGGLIADPHPRPRRGKAPEQDVLELEARQRGGPTATVALALQKAGAVPASPQALVAATGMTLEEVRQALAQLLHEAKAVRLDPEEVFVDSAVLSAAQRQVEQTLNRFHQQYPFRLRFDREQVRRALQPPLDARVSRWVLDTLVGAGKAKVQGEEVEATPGRPPLSAQNAALRNRVEAALRRVGLAGLDDEEAGRVAGNQNVGEVLLGLVQERIAAKVGERFVHRDALEEAASLIRRHFDARPLLSVAEFRDAIRLSRKFALPLLEYFDAQGLTRRSGANRVAGPAISGGRPTPDASAG